MFTITLRLQEETLNGIQALDFRRRLQLPQTSAQACLRDAQSSQSGARNASAKVDEAFARAYFRKDESSSWATVPAKFLVPGDVIQLDCNSYAVTFAPDLPAERVKELYLAVRFAACRAQVARLTRELEELKASV